MKHLALIGLLALGGCAAFGPQPQVMTADQLREYAKDKNASAACGIIIGAGWTSKVSFINADETRSNGTSVTINSDNCGMAVSTTPQPPAVRQCAPTSIDKLTDGTCYRIDRDAACNQRGATLVPCPI